MLIATGPTMTSRAAPGTRGATGEDNLPRPTASLLALQFAESLDLQVVLDRIARRSASLFQGVCRIWFTPANRPADARCTIAIPDEPPTTCTVAGAARNYADLLSRLEEYRRSRGPDQEPRGADQRATSSVAELLLAPLIARGRHIGTIDLVIPASDPTSVRYEQSLLRELAAHGALAIDTADYLTRRQGGAGPEPGPANEQDQDLLLAVLAHDLRTPLTSLSTSVQLLVREVRGAQRPGADRLERLAELAAASVARLEAQVSALTPDPAPEDPSDDGAGETIDIVRLTQLIANFYQQTTGRHGISVVAEQPEIFGHWTRAQLERVLGNLLLNAIKYSPEGGEITVGVDCDEDSLGRWATLSVENRGRGIPLQDLPGLSQPGHRARNVYEIPGMGLGLTSVREVVKQQGGSFALQSEVGGPTTVLVRLPL